MGIYEFPYSPLSWNYLRYISQAEDLLPTLFFLLFTSHNCTRAGRIKTDLICNLHLISSLGQGPPGCWCPSQCLVAITTQTTTLFLNSERAAENQRNHSGSLKNKSFCAAPAAIEHLGFPCFFLKKASFLWTRIRKTLLWSQWPTMHTENLREKA